VVFVGRSLVDMGGSDMLEVAALAKPIVVGQYTYNFEQTMHLLTKDKAICIATGEQSLTEAVVDLFTQKEAAAEMAHRARMIIVQNTGATERSATEIFKLLDRDIC
jgi:3-deoxy-D-manno-octulosonic-acid transferase